MAEYGLIGQKLGYSFSKTFFSTKFAQGKLPHTYHNFEIRSPSDIQKVIAENPNLKGLNVTIPFKESIIPFLDKVDNEAIQIGAVNTIKITNHKKLIGYNTDCYGFIASLRPFLPLKKRTALILGTGGASKAVAHALGSMGFSYIVVSRHAKRAACTYNTLTNKTIQTHFLVVNCTPLGTHPNILECPGIPYHFITKDHLLYDLVYNPPQTQFMERGALQGARTTNGMKMLRLQAEKAWAIWG
ncbi:MAG: shikimate dehydrogenase family protein [Marinirhabdus sp.]